MISQVIKINQIDSTQTMAKQMAIDGANSGTVVIASVQTNGKGQFLRKWNSQHGGLYFSLVLRPQKMICLSPSLSLKVGAVVAETLEEYFNIKAKIKFPNDVLLYNKNKKNWQKVCGILIESSSHDNAVEWLVLGIGVNLNNKISKELKDIAVSINALTGQKVDIDKFCSVLFKNFALRYRDWLNSVI